MEPRFNLFDYVTKSELVIALLSGALIGAFLAALTQ